MNEKLNEELEHAVEGDPDLELVAPAPIIQPPVKLDEDVDDKIVNFVAGRAECDLNVLTRDAANRMNLGLIYENIRILLDLKRQKEKIQTLENEIYSTAGINPDKNLVALYSFESKHYLEKVEYVRKYILNNKSALDALNGDVDGLKEVLSRLNKDQIEKLKGFVATLTEEKSVSDEDVLEEV